MRVLSFAPDGVSLGLRFGSLHTLTLHSIFLPVVDSHFSLCSTNSLSHSVWSGSARLNVCWKHFGAVLVSFLRFAHFFVAK